MKVLLLCGYFAKENEAEVLRHAVSVVQFSANQFQQKLICGFRKLEQELHVVSAPFIGSYPNASDVRVFRGFETPQEECRYVHFNNTWGVRNFSRAAALKREIRFFVEDPSEEKCIVVYCPHTPFLEAAAYAKRKDPRIRICLYVPDLPNYMNLDANRSRLYDIAKFFDNANMKRYMKLVDSYVLLTEYMKEALPVGDKPYMVAEGIVSDIPEPNPEPENDDCVKRIVYTGKLNEKFGIRDLIEGFRMIPGEAFQLVLCGAGDCLAYAESMAKKDKRIIVTGQVSPDVAADWQKKAAVLVNPRPNNEIYTRYSFPSKIIEYLLTGKPVVACLLDGMPACYGEYLYRIDSSCPAPEAIRDAIMKAASAGGEDRKRRHREFVAYARKNLAGDRIAGNILEMMR